MNLKDLVEKAFAPDGYLVGHGYSYREEQHEYARHVVRWLEGNYPAALEGDTGIGKGLAYLLPLAVYLALHKHKGVRGVVSTYTIALQSQLLSSEIPMVQRYLEAKSLQPLKIVRRLGRGQFCDQTRAMEHILELQSEPEADQLPEEMDLLQAFAIWVAGIGTHEGIIPDFIENYGRLPKGISLNRIALSSTVENETFEAHKAAAQQADLVITSHAVMVHECVRPGTMLGVNRPVIAVFDEADKFPAAASSILTRRLQPDQVITHLKTVLDVMSGRAKTGRTLINEAMEKAKAVESMLASVKPTKVAHVPLNHLGNLERGTLATTARELAQDLTNLVLLLRKTQLKTNAINKFRVERGINELNKAIPALQTLIQNEKSGKSYGHSMIHYSPVRNIPSIETMAVNAGAVMVSMATVPKKREAPEGSKQSTEAEVVKNEGTLYNPVESPRFLITSATLCGIPKQGEQHVSWGEFGIAKERTAFTVRISPKVYGNLSFVLSPHTGSKPFQTLANDEGDDDFCLSPEWLDHVANMVRTAAATQGNVLVLSNSFAETTALATRMHDLEHPLHAHRLGSSLREHVYQFQRRGGVLISPSAWEGHNIRRVDGSQLFNQLVATRIPRYPRDENYEEALFHFYATYTDRVYTRENIKQMVAGLLVTLAFRRLKQGFGRAIRQATDDCTIWVGDPRFPIYGEQSPFKGYTPFQHVIAERFQERWQKALIFNESQLPLAAIN